MMVSGSPEPSCSGRPIDLSCPLLSPCLPHPTSHCEGSATFFNRKARHGHSHAHSHLHTFPFSHIHNLADLTHRHVLTGSHTLSPCPAAVSYPDHCDGLFTSILSTRSIFPTDPVDPVMSGLLWLPIAY